MLSKNLEFFESAYDVLNRKYFGGALSKSVLIIQTTPKAYGHFTQYEAWEDKEGGYYEINIGAETLNRPLHETIATLIHEMVHQYCYENDIKDTSRNGTYHNKLFKHEAEARGLIIGFDKRIGHSPTTPARELIEFCKTEWQYDVDIHRKAKNRAGSKKPTSTRKYSCPSCGQSIRATKEVNIICGECNEKMVCEDTEKGEGEDSRAA